MKKLLAACVRKVIKNKVLRSLDWFLIDFDKTGITLTPILHSL